MIQSSGLALGEITSERLDRGFYNFSRRCFPVTVSLESVDDSVHSVHSYLGFARLIEDDLVEVGRYSGLKGIELADQLNLHARSVINIIEGGLGYTIEESGLKGDKLAERVGIHAKALKDWLNRMQNQGIHIPERELVHYSRGRGYQYEVGERVPMQVSSSRRLKEEVIEKWETARRIGMPPELLVDLAASDFEWSTITWYNQRHYYKDKI